MSEPIQHFYRFGPFSIDPQKRVLLRQGEAVPLAPKAFDTLLALVEHHGEVLEKDRLMDILWPDSQVEEANLPLHVSAVRKALGESPNERRYIITIPGRGYRFAAEVVQVENATDVIVARYTKSTFVIQDSQSSPQLEETAEGSLLAAPPRTGNEECQAGDVGITRPGQIDIVGGLVQPDKLEVSIAPSELPNAISASGALRRRNVMIVLAALLGLTAATLVIYWLTDHDDTKDKAAASHFREIDISRISTSGKVTHAAISPDGKYVAQVTEDAEGDSLWVRNIASPANLRVAGPAETEYVWVSFAPDGDSVYYLALDRDKGDTDLYRVGVLGGPS